jgi:DNA-binding transcriptional regulator YhcF (GntR family)
MKQLDILGRLFGSMTRVKLMKYFLLNQEAALSVEDLAERLRVKPKIIKPDLAELAKVGMIKPKSVTKVTVRGKKSTRKKLQGYLANKEFSMSEPLRSLLVDAAGTHIPDLLPRFNKIGKVVLFLVSGIFLHDNDRTMDLMIVGDRLNRNLIDRRIKELEAEIGKELRYSVFELDEFMYRLNMYDKLLRDVLDYPHEKLINKIDHPEFR